MRVYCWNSFGLETESLRKRQGTLWRLLSLYCAIDWLPIMLVVGEKEERLRGCEVVNKRDSCLLEWKDTYQMNVLYVRARFWVWVYNSSRKQVLVCEKKQKQKQCKKSCPKCFKLDSVGNFIYQTTVLSRLNSYRFLYIKWNFYYI